MMIKTNEKDLKMNNKDTRLSTIFGTLFASANGGALIYSIYLIFTITA